MRAIEPCKGLAICRTKEVPPILSYFETLNTGPSVENEKISTLV